MDDSTITNEHNNAKLAYEYTKNYLEKGNKDLERINQRLTTTLGSGAILLKFSADLEDGNPTLLLTKIFSCCILIITIGFCLHGLKPGKNGSVVLPDDLLNTEWYYKEESICMLYIARQWMQAREEVETVYEEKAKSLRSAYWSLFFLSVTFGVNIVVKATFGHN